MNGPTQTIEQNKEIVSLYEAGWNIFELGARYNFAPGTIRKIVTAARGNCQAGGLRPTTIKQPKRK